jgi:hypothetical protein
LAAGGYQFCIVDPEGDYAPFAGAAQLGDAKRTPSADEVIELLARPEQSLIVNLLGLKLEDRPPFFAALLPRLQELRSRTARPHWIVVDEAHHVLPASWRPAATTLSSAFDRVVLVTLHPRHLAEAALAAITTVIGVGEAPETIVRDFGAARGVAAPALPADTRERGDALAWTVGEPTVRAFRVAPPRSEHRRHRRKYAQGALSEDASFYFRGPEGKLNLRAQNLMLFMQLADGVDDATWLHHLRHGDYSAWLRSAIKDDGLADAVAAVERAPDLSPGESRARVRAAIEERYTLGE